MEIAYLGYLLFVLPGFCFVWTYRHFTRAERLGDFEYAAWSFLFGTIMFYITFWIGGDDMNFVMDLSKPFDLFGHSLGTGLGISVAASFPLGFALAFISEAGLFKWINEKLFWVVRKVK